MRLIRHVGNGRGCLAEGASPAKLVQTEKRLTLSRASHRPVWGFGVWNRWSRHTTSLLPLFSTRPPDSSTQNAPRFSPLIQVFPL